MARLWSISRWMNSTELGWRSKVKQCRWLQIQVDSRWKRRQLQLSSCRCSRESAQLCLFSQKVKSIFWVKSQGELGRRFWCEPWGNSVLSVARGRGCSLRAKALGSWPSGNQGGSTTVPVSKPGLTLRMLEHSSCRAVLQKLKHSLTGIDGRKFGPNSVIYPSEFQDWGPNKLTNAWARGLSAKRKRGLVITKEVWEIINLYLRISVLVPIGVRLRWPMWMTPREDHPSKHL